MDVTEIDKQIISLEESIKCFQNCFHELREELDGERAQKHPNEDLIEQIRKRMNATYYKWQEEINKKDQATKQLSDKQNEEANYKNNK